MDVELKERILTSGKLYSKKSYLDKHLNEEIKSFFIIKKKLNVNNVDIEYQLILNELITLNNLFNIIGILEIFELILDEIRIEIINSFLLFLFNTKISGNIYDKQILFYLENNFKKYKNDR